MVREDTYSVKVSVEGADGVAVDLGVWDKQSGGEVDSEETTYRPGGLADQITLGGAVTTGNVTVQKLYVEAIHNVFGWLVDRVGKAKVIVTVQPLDANGDAWGKPIAYTGKLKAVTKPDVDSEGNGAALISLEITVQGKPTQ